MELILILILILIAFYSMYKLNSNIVYAFPLFYVSIFIYTYLGANYFEYAYKVPFSDQVAYQINVQSLGLIYIYCTLGFVFGAKVGGYNYIYGRKSNILPYRTEISINIKEYYVYFLVFLTILLGWLAYDFGQIISRTSYVVDNNHKLVILHKLMIVLTSFLVVFVRNFYIRILLFLLLIMIPFSLNSRTLSLCILMFYLGIFFKNGFKLKYNHMISMFVLLLFSFLTTFGFRSQGEQGLIPNLISLFNFNFDGDLVFNSINYVTSYSVFATQYAIDNNYSDFKSFLISVSPLPSSLLDIDYVIDNSKINAFSPVPALAMSFNAGPFICILYYFIAGLVFSYILNNLKKSRFYFLAVGLFFLFIFTNSQYMIREGTRLIYYISLFYIFRIIFIRFKFY